MGITSKSLTVGGVVRLNTSQWVFGHDLGGILRKITFSPRSASDDLRGSGGASPVTDEIARIGDEVSYHASARTLVTKGCVNEITNDSSIDIGLPTRLMNRSCQATVIKFSNENS